jgi:hypothetical protein
MYLMADHQQFCEFRFAIAGVEEESVEGFCERGGAAGYLPLPHPDRHRAFLLPAYRQNPQGKNLTHGLHTMVVTYPQCLDG